MPDGLFFRSSPPSPPSYFANERAPVSFKVQLSAAICKRHYNEDDDFTILSLSRFTDCRISSKLILCYLKHWFRILGGTHVHCTRSKSFFTYMKICDESSIFGKPLTVFNYIYTLIILLMLDLCVHGSD